MSWLAPITLEGRELRLEPLALRHGDALSEAVQVGNLWRRPHADVPAPCEMHAEIGRRLDLEMEGQMLAFAAVLRATLEAVGMTAFFAAPRRDHVEVGGAWYRQDLHGTGVNSEGKLLMLEFAFERLRVRSVGFRTHPENLQCRAALERLGATLERGARPDGMCGYRVDVQDWPEVRPRLEAVLAAKASATRELRALSRGIPVHAD